MRAIRLNPSKFLSAFSRIALVFQSVCSRTIAYRLFFDRIELKQLDGKGWNYFRRVSYTKTLCRKTRHIPSKFFSAIQLYGWFLWDGISSLTCARTAQTRTQTHLMHRLSRPIFFQPSTCIRVNLLSYDSQPTETRGKSNWRAVKKLDGIHLFSQNVTDAFYFTKNCDGQRGKNIYETA